MIRLITFVFLYLFADLSPKLMFDEPFCAGCVGQGPYTDTGILMPNGLSLGFLGDSAAEDAYNGTCEIQNNAKDCDSTPCVWAGTILVWNQIAGNPTIYVCDGAYVYTVPPTVPGFPTEIHVDMDVSYCGQTGRIYIYSNSSCTGNPIGALVFSCSTCDYSWN